MKKKALRKDFSMEVKNTLNRFLSIFLITALGVAFFAGIRACEPDMELSADRFYDENDYMDIRVLSTLGLTDDDVRELEKIEGVEKIVPSYTVDVLSYRDEGMYTLKVSALSNELNKITPTQGRLPEKSGECILDSGLAVYGYEVGDTIRIHSGTDDDIEDSFHVTEYTVVGMGTTPAYLSLERESSQIGRGYVDGFMAVCEEDFAMDVYTEIYMSVEGAKELVSYREDYVDLVDGVVDNIEVIQAEREEARYLEVKEEADEAIADAEKELADGKKEADEELTDAYNKITDAKQDIADAKRDIADGKRELADGKKELADGKKEIEDNKVKLLDAQKEIEDAKAEIADGWKEVEAGKAELAEKKAEFEAQMGPAKKELEAQKAALSEQEAQFEMAKGFMDAAAIAATEQKLSEAKAQIAAYEAQFADGEAQLLKAEEEILAAEKELKEAEAEVVKGEKEIEDGFEELAKAEGDIIKAERDIAKAEKDIKDGEKELADGEQELIENEAKYWKEKAKADKEIADAEEELADAKLELADLKEAKWYILSREYSQVYAEFGQNAERIGALADVFPFFFFLIAALVCLTTMTRMVEEQRTQIGTLKALGYSKGDIAFKYIMYAAIASLFGGIFGALVGQKVLPAVVVSAYQMLYVNLPYRLLPYNGWYSVSAIAMVMGCTLLATYFSCASALKSNAAELMRPEAPKAGKRVLLERIGFIWNRLSFGQKSSVRNLFRYKKRFFMTIIGIGGCMALLIVGFGLRDSIYDIAKFQYEELFVYTGYIAKNADADEEEVEELYDFLDKQKNINEYLPVYQASVDLAKGKTEKQAYLICPEITEGFGEYILFRDRLSKEEFAFEEDMEGIVLTEKMASMLGVTVGDTISVKTDDTTSVDVKIAYLTENYAMHYIYLTPELYEELFGEVPEYNLLYYKAVEQTPAEKDMFAEKLLAYEAASEIQYNDESKESVEDMLGALDLVIWVLIICAGLLAFVVLYNLNNININERRRELATLRVLGFHNKEVAAYVYRESVMLTVIGIVLGAFLGVALHRYVILTVEVDMLMFARKINLPSYIYSSLLTIFFSALINWVMYFKLKKIDMVESLKSIE